MPPAGGSPQGPADLSPGGEEHLLSPAAAAFDAQEVSLRPRRLEEYVGQSRIKDNLRVFISAAAGRGEALDHVLLHGTPGLGKTTLAHVIAAEAGVSLRTTSGPAVEKPGDLAALLTNLNARDVLFIDEIHRLPTIVEETLYPAMEDFHLDLIVGQGPSARSVKYPLPPFTLIGATTRVGLLTSPLRARFGVTHLLEPYTDAELLDILLGEDLLGHVDPIQLSIRLLIPPGSLLLEDNEVAALVEPLDAEAMLHPWAHADSRMDQLQGCVMSIVENLTSASEDPLSTFQQIFDATAQELGRSPVRLEFFESAPRLTEPWFC